MKSSIYERMMYKQLFERGYNAGLPERIEECLMLPFGDTNTSTPVGAKSHRNDGIGVKEATCMEMNPFGTVLATGCRDGSVLLWDYETRQVAKMLRLDEEKRNWNSSSREVVSVVWSGDGHQLVCGRKDGAFVMWNVLTGEVVCAHKFDERKNKCVSVGWLGGEGVRFLVSFSRLWPVVVELQGDGIDHHWRDAKRAGYGGGGANPDNDDRTMTGGNDGSVMPAGKYGFGAKMPHDGAIHGDMNGDGGTDGLNMKQTDDVMDSGSAVTVSVRKVPMVDVVMDGGYMMLTSNEKGSKGSVIGACSHDASLYAVATMDSVSLYESSNGYLLDVVPTSSHGQVQGVSFSPDGAHLLVSYSSSPMVFMIHRGDTQGESVDKSCIMFGRQKRQDLKSAMDDPKPCLTLHGRFKSEVEQYAWGPSCFAPDGEHVFSCLDSQKEHIIYTWNFKYGYAANVLEGADSSRVMGVICHPDPVPMQLLALSGSGKKLYIWSKMITQKWSLFSPDFEVLDRNREYIETENEFDDLPGEDRMHHRKLYAHDPSEAEDIDIGEHDNSFKDAIHLLSSRLTLKEKTTLVKATTRPLLQLPVDTLSYDTGGDETAAASQHVSCGHPDVDPHEPSAGEFNAHAQHIVMDA